MQKDPCQGRAHFRVLFHSDQQVFRVALERHGHGFWQDRVRGVQQRTRLVPRGTLEPKPTRQRELPPKDMAWREHCMYLQGEHDKNGCCRVVSTRGCIEFIVCVHGTDIHRVFFSSIVCCSWRQSRPLTRSHAFKYIPQTERPLETCQCPDQQQQQQQASWVWPLGGPRWREWQGLQGSG